MPDVEAWWVREATHDDADTIARAARGGFAADRLGWAFASGYRAALASLSFVVGAKRAALCATERGGGHPRAIETSLAKSEDGGFMLDGHKRFATLGMLADVFVVIASIDKSGPRNQLRAVLVAADAPGLTRTVMPDTPFCPEVQHAALRFEGVRVAPSDVLPGDAYEEVLKPFRTVEDAHVIAAALAHAVRIVREHDVEKALAERAVAALVAVAALSREPPLSPAVHLAMSGVFAWAAAIFADVTSALNARGDVNSKAIAARLTRDAPLFAIASTVRGLRTARAWSSFEAGR